MMTYIKTKQRLQETIRTAISSQNERKDDNDNSDDDEHDDDNDDDDDNDNDSTITAMMMITTTIMMMTMVVIMTMIMMVIVIVIVIVNSKFLKRHSKAKRRAPDYSRALRQIREVFQRIVRGRLRSVFQRVRECVKSEVFISMHASSQNLYPPSKISGYAPVYLQELCRPVSTLIGRQALRSSSGG